MALTTPLTAEDTGGTASKLVGYQKWVFFVTFMNYAMSHFSRKCYTNVKVNLKEAGVDTVILSQMDTGFMFTYAIGSFISGRLGDTYSPAMVVGVGLLGSTLCLSLISMFVTTDIVHSNYALASMLFLGAQLIHGLFQSTGGPVNTVIMGGWFPKKGRGLVFGLWTCHQYIGDVVAALATAWMLGNGWPWLWALMVPALSNGLWAIVNFVILPNKPGDVGLALPSDTADTATATSKPAPTKDDAPGATIGFVQALMLPNVLNYAVAFGFFKLTNYAMFFWLPYFLSLHFDPQSANVISSLYSVGMMPGGVIVGWVSDLMDGKRACVIAVFMILLIPLLYLFALYSAVMPAPMLLGLLCCMGILVGGPNNIITSAVAADLADHPSLKGNSRALGTVTGIINGSGSITAALGLMIIGPLQVWAGWAAVWYFLILCVAIGTALMTPKIMKELNQGNSGYNAVGTTPSSA